MMMFSSSAPDGCFVTVLCVDRMRFIVANSVGWFILLGVSSRWLNDRKRNKM